MWNNIELMFPTNQIETDEGIHEASEDFPYDSIEQKRQYFARNMVIKEVIHEWNKNGEHNITTSYDITNSPFSNQLSCLNVFGRKMLINYMLRRESNDARFNYTGL